MRGNKTPSSLFGTKGATLQAPALQDFQQALHGTALFGAIGTTFCLIPDYFLSATYYFFLPPDYELLIPSYLLLFQSPCINTKGARKTIRDSGKRMLIRGTEG